MSEADRMAELTKMLDKMGLTGLSLGGLYNNIPTCAREGHSLITDNGGVYLCRFCAKRFAEVEPTTTATAEAQAPPLTIDAMQKARARLGEK